MRNLMGRYSLYQRGALSFRLLIFTIVCGIVFCSNTAVCAQETKPDYDSFKFDFSQIKDSPQIDRITKAVQRQIEIVGQVGLSEADLKFFKSVPVVMIPESSGTPGVYSAEKKTVFLKARDLAPNRPILLHEFLHAYHHQKITDGMRNAQLRTFYQQAGEKFPNYKDEYFLKNPQEFFAVTASIYLFGDIPRPPYNRAAIEKALPEYCQYLKTLFGEH